MQFSKHIAFHLPKGYIMLRSNLQLILKMLMALAEVGCSGLTDLPLRIEPVFGPLKSCGMQYAVSTFDCAYERNSGIIGGSCHKYHFCHVKTRVLSPQTRVCREITRVLSRLKHVCRDKHIFVATSLLLCLSRTCLSRQNTSFDKGKLVSTKV